MTAGRRRASKAWAIAAAQLHAKTGAPIEIGSIEKMSEIQEERRRPRRDRRTYGADTARWFMLSDSPPERDVQWTEGRHRRRLAASSSASGSWCSEALRSLFETPLRHDALPIRDSPSHAQDRRIAPWQRVGENIEGLRFNRAVAQIYELTNALTKFASRAPRARHRRGASRRRARRRRAAGAADCAR